MYHVDDGDPTPHLIGGGGCHQEGLVTDLGGGGMIEHVHDGDMIIVDMI